MRFGVEDWDAVVGALDAADEVALACHINPDGDALGSLLAASIGLRRAGKKTYPSWGTTPIVVPPNYEFLPEIDSLLEPGTVPPVQTFLALDCGAGDRLGELEPLAQKADTLINIDHHPGNDRFGTLNVVVTTVSSTAELVTRLLQDLNVDLDRSIATCLYTGVVTDTGRFQYSNSSPDTLRLAAHLLSLDVSAPDIARDVFESSPWGYLKLLGRVLERAELFEEERLVCSWITLDDLSENDVGLEETDRLVDLIRSTRAADVAAMFKQQPDGTWRVSLRSKGPNVGDFARANGGGGHDLAAGFTAADRDEAMGRLRSTLAKTSRRD